MFNNSLHFDLILLIYISSYFSIKSGFFLTFSNKWVKNADYDVSFCDICLLKFNLCIFLSGVPYRLSLESTTLTRVLSLSLKVSRYYSDLLEGGQDSARFISSRNLDLWLPMFLDWAENWGSSSYLSLGIFLDSMKSLTLFELRDCNNLKLGTFLTSMTGVDAFCKASVDLDVLRI